MEITMKKLYAILTVVLLFCQLFSACGRTAEPLTKTGFCLNTVIEVTIFENGSEALLEECFSLAETYEGYFSATIPDSDIAKINASAGTPVTVHDETAELLSIGIAYGELSGGRFDITIGGLSELWDISTKALLEQTDASMIPANDQIEQALSDVDYHAVRIDGNVVTLQNQDARIDLGGIAKGYIADRMKEFLIENGVTSGFINLGGNVLVLGPKPDGSPCSIAIQRPFSEEGDVAASVKITDQTVVSSGIYERYFEAGGRIYHHILDTATGYPYDNGLLSVTVITKNSVDGDALSTICFSLGLTDGMELIERTDGAEAVFITDDETLHTSSGIGTDIPFTEF